MKTNLLKIKKVLAALLCCIAFAACNEDKADLLSGGDDAVLQLGASVTGLTRANDAGFEVGDSLGVFVVKWKSNVEQDSLLTNGNYADNICFRLDKLPNDWIADRLTYYPNDDNMIDLYAYYPYRTPAFGTGTVVNLTVASNQSSYRNYTLSDFMVAQTDSVSRSPFKVPLVFDHKLSQMVFELKPGTGFTANDLMNAKVKVINAITEATFDLAAIKGGSPVAGTTRADIIPCGTWTESGGLLTGMKAIVVPQPINATTYIQVTIGSRTFTYKPTEAKNMNIGCSRKFIITINNTGLDITTAINPWDNCPLVEGDAEEEWPVVYMQTFVPNPADTVGTEVMLTDKRDNIVYRCIKMADGRWWMGENLRGRFGTFVEGQPTETYGLMYDWDTNKDYVPEGWSLPTDAEWTALGEALGGTSITDGISVAGGKMKSTTGWNNDGNGTNESGWNGLPGGNYNTGNGRYYSKGAYSYWWSAESYDYWRLYCNDVYLYGPHTNNGSLRFSVRCILEEKETIQYMQTFVPNPADTVGTEVMLTDKRDNIVYRCIKMADGRWWMGENLKYDISGSVFYDNDSTNLVIYGRLYNWQEALDAAPENWNVPSDDEWKVLEMALGMTQEEADKEGERGTDQDSQLLKGGRSGMDLLLGGCHRSDSVYFSLGLEGFYWTSTQINSFVWKRQLGCNYAGVTRGYLRTNNWFSVRYVKNL